jgi:acetyl-CoA acetyltransferase
VSLPASRSGPLRTGQVALTARKNAALTDDAPYRVPLSLDDYLSARMISEPLCLYDCDVPIDGSIALVVSPARDKEVSQGRSSSTVVSSGTGTFSSFILIGSAFEVPAHEEGTCTTSLPV